MNFFNYLSEKKIIILLVSIILNFILLGGNIYLIYSKLNYECAYTETENLVINDESEEIANENFYVEVKGEVKKPGVYEVNNKNIINDVINLAGGFTKSAYTDNINLSKKVSNELVIYIFSKSEYKKLNEVPEVKVCECESYKINDCTEKGVSEIITSSTDDSTSVSNSDNTTNSIITNENTNNEVTEENNKESSVDTIIPSEEENKLININKATLEELKTLSGIGDSKAKAIIEYRNKTPFKNIEDIKNVSGIGEAAFEKIKDSITV